MSINITIHASDIKGLDEKIERALDISDYYGTSLFDDEHIGRLIAREDYEYYISPSCYLGLMMNMQQQIKDIEKYKTLIDVLTIRVSEIEKDNGKHRGHYHNKIKAFNSDISSLDIRIEGLEKEVQKL